jgi:hypothetical protein
MLHPVAKTIEETPSMNKRLLTAIVYLGLVLCLSTTALLAQSATTTPNATKITAAPPAGEPANMRFFQLFIPDAQIVNKQWWGIEFQWDRGAVPPFKSADGIVLVPTFAISPIKNLEVGGSLPFIDYELDNGYIRPGTTSEFTGDSGIGDLLTWAKYRFYDGPVQVTGGVTFSLPTGSDSAGLGNGEFTPGIFGSVRMKVEDGYFLGTVAFNFYGNATILDTEVDGKTATLLGGAYIWEGYPNWLFSGEVTAQSELYEGYPSDFRATAGAQYLGVKHSIFRGAVEVGLSDGAPDFQLILGYAYTF